MWILCNNAIDGLLQSTGERNLNNTNTFIMEDVHRLHCSPELPVLWSFRGVILLSYCKFLSRQRLKVLKYRSAIRYGFLLTLVTVHKSLKANTYIGVNCTALCMLICMLFWLEKRYKYNHKRAILNLLDFSCMW